MLGFLVRRDHRIMQRANHWVAPRWVQLAAKLSTRAGDGWLWAGIALLLLVFGDGDRFAAVGAGGLASILSILLFMCVKRVAGRRRPCEIEPHCWSHLLPPDRFSFPSGHTMTAFAVTVAMSMFYVSIAPVMLFFALCIGTSRILLGMHFLSDVLAGMLLGCGLGYFSYLMFQ